MNQKLTALLVSLPLFCASCESMPRAHDGDSGHAASAKQEGGDAEDGSREEKLRKAERALANARLEHKIAQAEVEARARKAEDEVAEAEHGLQRATEALEQFARVEREFQLAKAQVGVERAAWNLEAQKQELAELEAMYAKDDVATLTKELVLQRGKKQVEFATRNLDHEQREAAALREYELPRKQRDLEQDRRGAQSKLREARAAKARSADENELKLRKSTADVEDAERALEKLKKQGQKS